VVRTDGVFVTKSYHKGEVGITECVMELIDSKCGVALSECGVGVGLEEKV